MCESLKHHVTTPFGNEALKELHNLPYELQMCIFPTIRLALRNGVKINHENHFHSRDKHFNMTSARLFNATYFLPEPDCGAVVYFDQRCAAWFYHSLSLSIILPLIEI